MSSGGRAVLSADKVEVTPRWLPLILRRRLSIDRLSFEHPKIRIERSHLGRVMDEVTAASPGKMRLLSIEHGDVTYVDETWGGRVEVGDLNLRLTDVSWGQGAVRQPLVLLKSLSLHGTLHATELRMGAFTASGMSSRINGEVGLLQLDSTELALFGGRSVGSLTVDLRGPAARIHLVQAASGIELAQVFPDLFLFGNAETSFDVEGTGNDQRTIKKSMKGQVAIRSGHVTVKSVDVDGVIADYHRTQNFSLIDLAAFVLVGPFAPLVTKGVDLSRLTVFGHVGKGQSAIRRVVSDWTIADGIASAEDVAFATPKNTVAFQGALDLVNERYRDFFVATVDQHGCAQVKRQISGPLAHPQAEGPVATGLGPFTTALRNAKQLFQSRPCDLFYSGSAIN